MTLPSTFSAAVVALLLAAPIASAQAPPPAALQRRVDALAQQLQLRYGRNAATLATRRADAKAVLDSWNRVARSSTGARASEPTNRDVMERWLDEAFAAVMPGGSGQLPPAPEFRSPPASLVAPIAASRTPPSAVAAPTPLEALANEPSGVSADSSRAGRNSPQAAPVRVEAAKPVAPLVAGQPTTGQPADVDGALPLSVPAASDAAAPEGSKGPDWSMAPERSKWSRHPAAAPLEWRDPFADDPAASANPLRGVQREVLRPIRAPQTARVDVANLAAEIRGFNAAVRELQAELDGLRVGRPSDRSLGRIAERVDRLQERGEFLQLYRRGVAAEERWALPDAVATDVLGEQLRRWAGRLADQNTDRRPTPNRSTTTTRSTKTVRPEVRSTAFADSRGE